MVLTLREARRLLAILLVPLALIGYLIFSFAPAPPEVEVVGERVQAIGTRSPYDDRSQIYNEALREIREDPVTGVGPGGFIVSSRRAGTATSTVSADHAHNLLLNYGAESGLPAVGDRARVRVRAWRRGVQRQSGPSRRSIHATGA